MLYKKHVHSLVSCLVVSLSRRKGIWNDALGPGLAAEFCATPAPLAPALPTPAALPVEALAPALRLCKWELINHCMCMRMLLMMELVRSISSLTRWLSLNTIMLVRPSSSFMALVMRDTSSRRESCSVRRWCTCESKGGWVDELSVPCVTGGNEAGGRRKSGVGAKPSALFASRGSVTGNEASLELAGYRMLVMLARPSSSIPTFRARGSIRASLRSMRACCSRK